MGKSNKQLEAELEAKNDQIFELESQLKVALEKLGELQGFEAPKIGDQVVVNLKSWAGLHGVLISIEGEKAIVECVTKRSKEVKQWPTKVTHLRPYDPSTEPVPAPEANVDLGAEADAAELAELEEQIAAEAS